MSKLRLSHGFTLLEMLIALFVFAVLTTLAYGGLNLILNSQQQIERSADGLASVQRVFLFIQQDLQQVRLRPVRDEYGSSEAAFEGGGEDRLLHLTRGGVTFSLHNTGADLRRVEYQLQGKQLYRRVWSALDRVQGNQSSRLCLAEGVETLEFKFIGYKENQWHSTWSSLHSSSISGIPRAVEVILRTELLGEVSRLFMVGS